MSLVLVNLQSPNQPITQPSATMRSCIQPVPRSPSLQVPFPQMGTTFLSRILPAGRPHLANPKPQDHKFVLNQQLATSNPASRVEDPALSAGISLYYIINLCSTSNPANNAGQASNPANNAGQASTQKPAPRNQQPETSNQHPPHNSTLTANPTITLPACVFLTTSYISGCGLWSTFS